MRYSTYFGAFVALMIVGMGSSSAWTSRVEALPGVCRPKLSPPQTIQLGKPGIFSWSCEAAEKSGNGYYVVFIRPSGTYVLLKVPEGRTSFEFTPDTVGGWRWIVINTDPDGAKPDVESEPGNFIVEKIEPGQN